MINEKDKLERARVYLLRSREMRDNKSYCFVCGKTELLYQSPEDYPKNAFRCEYCSEDVCLGCKYSRSDADVCIPCGDEAIAYAEKQWSHA